MLTILVGGIKGGVGKSTLAQNLSVQFATEGFETCLLDTDELGTSSNWLDRRAEITDGPKVYAASAHGDVYSQILEMEYEFIIIDAGGKDSVELRTSMVAADILLLPLRPSQADLETLVALDDMIANAKVMNPSLIVKVVLTQVPTHSQSTEAADALDLIKLFENLPVSTNHIYNRTVYRTALLKGKGVVEMRNAQAKAEIQLLVDELKVEV